MRAFVTTCKLVSCIADMEHNVPLSLTDEIVAKRMEQKLCELDEDFREYQYSILDLMEEGVTLMENSIDEHEAKISNLTIRSSYSGKTN